MYQKSNPRQEKLKPPQAPAEVDNPNNPNAISQNDVTELLGLNDIELPESLEESAPPAARVSRGAVTPRNIGSTNLSLVQLTPRNHTEPAQKSARGEQEPIDVDGLRRGKALREDGVRPEVERTERQERGRAMQRHSKNVKHKHPDDEEVDDDPTPKRQHGEPKLLNSASDSIERSRSRMSRSASALLNRSRRSKAPRAWGEPESLLFTPETLLGEMAMLKDARNPTRTGTVTALRRLHVVRIVKEDLLRLIDMASAAGDLDERPTTADVRAALSKAPNERSKHDIATIVRYFGELPLFAKLPWQIANELCACMLYEPQPAKRILFLQVRSRPHDAHPLPAGGPGEKYMVLAGCVRLDVRDENPDGSTYMRTVGKLDSGSDFGDVALMRGGVRTATATVEMEAELATLDKKNYTRIMRGEDLSRIASVADIVQSCGGFQSWTRAAVLKVAFIMRVQDYSKGIILLKQNTIARDVFLLKTGSVKLIYEMNYVPSKDTHDHEHSFGRGKQATSLMGDRKELDIEVGLLSDKELVGDYSAVSSCWMPAHAVTMTPCEMVVMSQTDFQARVHVVDPGFFESAKLRHALYLERAASGARALLQFKPHRMQQDAALEEVARLEGLAAETLYVPPDPVEAERLAFNRCLNMESEHEKNARKYPPPANLPQLGGGIADPVLHSHEETCEDRKRLQKKTMLNDLVTHTDVVVDKSTNVVKKVHTEPLKLHTPVKPQKQSPEEPPPLLASWGKGALPPVQQRTMETLQKVGHFHSNNTSYSNRTSLRSLSKLSDNSIGYYYGSRHVSEDPMVDETNRTRVISTSPEQPLSAFIRATSRMASTRGRSTASSPDPLGGGSSSSSTSNLSPIRRMSFSPVPQRVAGPFGNPSRVPSSMGFTPTASMKFSASRTGLPSGTARTPSSHATLATSIAPKTLGHRSRSATSQLESLVSRSPSPTRSARLLSQVSGNGAFDPKILEQEEDVDHYEDRDFHLYLPTFDSESGFQQGYMEGGVLYF
ncbi:hypothetical protein CYMTET_15069 [Cymbomonas tetramitiformis]|uniref:Cyclic nucleotide-binding domain-containing protein n=1 Tax=Cymbomonas tetramitiformis TaxID=36881 RepID=A0AAE0L9P9_9CHLO|nr:hypothetical protein CYMTET_15069 [Cymbomonas tetramitiformis]